MKKYSVYLLTTLILTIVFGLSGCKNKKNIEEAKVGINIPLTGNYSYWGEEFKRGVDLFNESQDSIPVKLYIEDNQGKPANAVNSTNKLITIDKIDACVTLFAPFSFPLRELAQNNKTPLISTFNSATNFTEGFSYCFSDIAMHDQQLPPLVEYINNMGLKKGVYICVNDDYGNDGARIFTDLFSKNQNEINGEIFNSGNHSDFRNIVFKLLSNKPEFVFVIARDMDLTTFVNYIREQNAELPIFGLGTFDAPTVWATIPQENQDKIYFVSSYFNKDANQESQNFYRTYIEKYNKTPDYPAVYGYTISQYLTYCIYNSKINKTEIAKELKKLNYESIRGRIKMNDKQVILSPIALYKRANDQSIVIEIIE